MKLDRRMIALLKEIPQGKNLADIGADHGYISINYAINNKQNIVVGSDISEKSVEKAKVTAQKLGLTNYITKVGDGLKSIEDMSIDVILISGMGGEEIIKILDSAKKYPIYILSPQKNSDKVRKYLMENCLHPVKDYKVLSEDKFYDIMVCTQGEYKPTEFELLFGSGIGEDFEKYAQFMINQLTCVLNKVTNLQEKEVIEHKIKLLQKRNIL